MLYNFIHCCILIFFYINVEMSTRIHMEYIILLGTNFTTWNNYYLFKTYSIIVICNTM